MKELVKYNEFLNEQLFGRIRRRREEEHQEELQFEEERIRRLAEEEERRYLNGVTKAREEKPMLDKYIDIITNHPDRIKKTKFRDREHQGYGTYLYYGILFDDGTTVVSSYYKGYGMTGEMQQRYLRINDVDMSDTKEKKMNKEVDPFGEESWEENEKTSWEVLHDLVIDYVRKNEIIF